MSIINREFSMLRKWLLLIVLAIGLVGCAGLTGREPVQVNVVGIEPLQGQGLEVRFAVKLRVLNPNDTPVEFNGVYVALDVRGTDFASGVSDQQGTVGRFGETVLTVPVTVSATAMLKQLLSFAAGDRSKVSYQLRGKLAGSGFGSVRFESSGEFDLPAGLGGAAK
jgi:LEA14-like dessication related protein